jgi:hypothetical protein
MTTHPYDTSVPSDDTVEGPAKKILWHTFKPHEWRYIKGRSELVDLLENYMREFYITRWILDGIDHFLELYHYLYPGSFPEKHHIRCIATIITEEGL